MIQIIIQDVKPATGENANFVSIYFFPLNYYFYSCILLNYFYYYYYFLCSGNVQILLFKVMYYSKFLGFISVTVTVTASVIIPRPEHSCDSYKIINTNIKHLQHLQFLGSLKSPGP